jgi:hypothetical protein
MYWRRRQLKKTYDLVRREVLCCVLIDFGIPMKLVRLVKMCLNETYRPSKARVCKRLPVVFPVQNGLKEGGGLSPLFLNVALESAIDLILSLFSRA